MIMLPIHFTLDTTLAAIKAIGDSLDRNPKASPTAPWMPPVLPETRIYKPSNAEWLIARDSALLQSQRSIQRTRWRFGWRLASTLSTSIKLNIRCSMSLNSIRLRWTTRLLAATSDRCALRPPAQALPAIFLRAATALTIGVGS